MNTAIKVYVSMDDIYDKICELYKNKPQFIIHIIRSTFPRAKITRVNNFVKQGIKNRRCCISNQFLGDIDGISSYISKREGIDKYYIKLLISDKKTPIQQIETDSNGRRVALIGERTDRMLCIDAYIQLQKFVYDLINAGDSLISKSIYTEIQNSLSNEISTRFDTSIKYNKLHNNTINEFKTFINERVIDAPFNYKNIWDSVYNHKQQKQSNTNE